MAKLWGGRFTGATDPLMHAFNQSLSYDKRMYRADIIGSQAYAKGLVQAGVLTEDERKVSRYRKILDAMADDDGVRSQLIHDGLDKVLAEWQAGNFVEHESDEDIHTANERRLAELIGPTAGKI